MTAPTQPLTLAWLPGAYAVCRLDSGDRLPEWVVAAMHGGAAGREGECSHAAPGATRLFSVTRAGDEISIVIDESLLPAVQDGAAARQAGEATERASVRVERGYRAMCIVGTLDFSLTGIIASLTQPLAGAGIPVFVLSTYDTDVLLVRAVDGEQAAAALAGVARVV